ncbi:hypothetical protein HN011_000104 [Eciton burchellii]|nr:hypothetical protein HN011_000104 [Eciton burchellii]
MAAQEREKSSGVVSTGRPVEATRCTRTLYTSPTTSSVPVQQACSERSLVSRSVSAFRAFSSAFRDRDSITIRTNRLCDRSEEFRVIRTLDELDASEHPSPACTWS